MDEKKELLSRLYFLRAMLSKIAINRDEVDECFEVIEESEEKIESQKDNLELLKKNKEIFERFSPNCLNLSSKKDKMLRQLNVVENKIAEKSWDNEIKERQKSDSEIRSYLFKNVALPTIITVLLFFCSIFLSVWCLIPAIAATIGSLLWFKNESPFWTVNSYWITSKNQEAKEREFRKELEILIHRKYELEDEIKAISRKEREIIDREVHINKCKLNKAIEDINSTITSVQNLNAYKNRAQIKATAIIESSNNIYLTVKESFEGFLDERDWENLDIIIYELETGRADTMKEALQQADLYIRHDEIMGVMEVATDAICSTIKESIGELSRSIGRSLSNLRSEMSGLRSEIYEMNQTNRELANGLTTKFDDLISAQELSNALLKKANVSSEDLAEDVRRMRLIRDEEYYRT